MCANAQLPPWFSIWPLSAITVDLVLRYVLLATFFSCCYCYKPVEALALLVVKSGSVTVGLAGRPESWPLSACQLHRNEVWKGNHYKRTVYVSAMNYQYCHLWKELRLAKEPPKRLGRPQWRSGWVIMLTALHMPRTANVRWSERVCRSIDKGNPFFTCCPNADAYRNPSWNL